MSERIQLSPTVFCQDDYPRPGFFIEDERNPLVLSFDAETEEKLRTWLNERKLRGGHPVELGGFTVGQAVYLAHDPTRYKLGGFNTTDFAEPHASVKAGCSSIWVPVSSLLEERPCE